MDGFKKKDIDIGMAVVGYILMSILTVEQMQLLILNSSDFQKVYLQKRLVNVLFSHMDIQLLSRD